jgi:hypothetical protein
VVKTSLGIVKELLKTSDGSIMRPIYARVVFLEYGLKGDATMAQFQNDRQKRGTDVVNKATTLIASRSKAFSETWLRAPTKFQQSLWRHATRREQIQMLISSQEKSSTSNSFLSTILLESRFSRAFSASLYQQSILQTKSDITMSAKKPTWGRAPNLGHLSRETLDHTVSISDVPEDDRQCGICLMGFEGETLEGELLIKLACGHVLG